MVHIPGCQICLEHITQSAATTVGNKQRETGENVLCLEVEENENRAAKRTREPFSLNLPKRFPRSHHALTSSLPPAPLLFCYSDSLPDLLRLKKEEKI